MTKRMAIHPGEILREEFLKPMGLTSYRLAKEIEVPTPRMNDIVLERRGITADTALRLGRYFSTMPQFRMNLQSHYELRVAGDTAALDSIVPRRAVSAA